MKITFHNDPEGRSDTGALNYARGNRPGGGKSTTWCSADLRTASKEANYPLLRMLVQKSTIEVGTLYSSSSLRLTTVVLAPPNTLCDKHRLATQQTL